MADEESRYTISVDIGDVQDYQALVIIERRPPDGIMHVRHASHSWEETAAALASAYEQIDALQGEPLMDRKLKDGYSEIQLDADGGLGTAVAIMRHGDCAWWPANMAPDECFQPEIVPPEPGPWQETHRWDGEPLKHCSPGDVVIGMDIHRGEAHVCPRRTGPRFHLIPLEAVELRAKEDARMRDRAITFLNESASGPIADRMAAFAKQELARTKGK